MDNLDSNTNTYQQNRLKKHTATTKSLKHRIDNENKHFDILGHFDVNAKLEAEKSRDKLHKQLDKLKYAHIQNIKTRI
jgi:hypothetical protein